MEKYIVNRKDGLRLPAKFQFTPTGEQVTRLGGRVKRASGDVFETVTPCKFNHGEAVAMTLTHLPKKDRGAFDPADKELTP